jgi:Uma2 family endonuclease
MTTRVRLTYEDYAALPDDGRRYELHEGELSVTPAPGLVHQATLRNLVVILHSHVSARGLGEVFPAPVDCILEDVTVVQPDIVFVEAARRSIMGERGATWVNAWGKFPRRGSAERTDPFSLRPAAAQR